MKKLLAGVALSALLAVPAVAADLPARRMPVKAAPAPIVGMYNWSGFYIGGHAGYLFSDLEWSFPGTTTSHDLDGFVGGGHVGFNWQSGNFVFGIEGAVSGFSRDGSSTCFGGPVCHTEVDHFWRAGARAGFTAGATGNWLIYAMGGFARANVKTHLVVGGVETDRTNTHHHGGYVGGGIEYGWTPNLVIGLEGYHVFLGNEGHGAAVGTTRNVDLDFSVIQARLSWKFDAWGKSPVVARY
jgi:outer membrane immunogenic protein